ncbi:MULTISPECIES: T9SS type A sorting domain-containing protein [Hymenobacter]|uniref:Por secretion system C-terminal sorting domain-containing protein n=1 Tax=Hymenobacter mucosus TaxID=1411120 RepID=A0A238WA31_9BACT|nr:MULTISPECIES: T9SS type A sorting domain-containing protein [Hymenobacter]SNR43073.1 Por secretion system C-terminal sorting domain-containing protein [Hymenobacter mucosus]
MKISTRLFSLALLLLTQLPLLAASLTIKSGTAAYSPAQGTPGLSHYSSTSSALSVKALVPTLSVYPNPARGQVIVSVGQKLIGDYKLRLNNIIGREVRIVALRPEAMEGGMTINLADLPAGMYFYSLTLNDKVLSTKRLVLQN